MSYTSYDAALTAAIKSVKKSGEERHIIHEYMDEWAVATDLDCDTFYAGSKVYATVTPEGDIFTN